MSSAQNTLKRPLLSRRALLLFATPRFMKTHFLPWIYHLTSQGAVLHVGTTHATDKEVLPLLPENATYHPLPFQRSSLNPFLLLMEIWKTRQLCQKLEPQILHLFGWRMILIGLISTLLMPSSQRPARTICFVTGLGSIFTAQSLVLRLLKVPFLFMVGFLVKRCTPHLWVENEPDLQRLSQALKVPLPHQQCIPGAGIDLSHFTPQPLPAAKPLVLGYCGRFIRDKGLQELTQAMELVNQDGITVKLMLAGEIDPHNPSSFTENDVTAWSQIPGIVLCGPLAKEKLPAFWAQTHGAVLPSYGEGLPRMLLEAAAMEKPAIATHVSGCEEIIVENKTGTLVPPKETNALAAAIDRWQQLSSAQLRQMGQQARKRVEDDFSLPKVQKILTASYKD